MPLNRAISTLECLHPYPFMVQDEKYGVGKLPYGNERATLSALFANRHELLSLSSTHQQKRPLKLHKCISNIIKLLANPPCFWTKTDLRKSPVSCILLADETQKPTRSDWQERACFYRNVETPTPFPTSWRSCRDIGPNEGTEMLAFVV